MSLALFDAMNGVGIVFPFWNENSVVYIMNKVILGCLEIRNFSSLLQLDILRVSAASEWDIDLNARREIPYLRARMHYSLSTTLPWLVTLTYCSVVLCIVGSNHMYILVNPQNNEKAEGTPDDVDWEFAQKEIAQAKGFATGFGSGLSKGTTPVLTVWKLLHI